MEQKGRGRRAEAKYIVRGTSKDLRNKRQGVESKISKKVERKALKRDNEDRRREKENKIKKENTMSLKNERKNTK